MKKFVLFLLVGALVTSCAKGPTQEQYDSLIAQNKKLQHTIDQLRDSVSLLSFPADQRFNQIQNLVKIGNMDEARNQIQALRNVFPHSKEAEQCLAVLADIQKQEEIIKAEQARIEALGFKALTPKTKFSIGYNTVTLSSISTGDKFIFDRYDDHYRYQMANRGYKFISATMNIESSNNNPMLPQPAIYKISGGQMTKVSSFMVRFYKWKNYGTYLGNNADYANDFSKAEKINFSIAAHVPSSTTSEAYAIVCKNKNELVRQYEQFENPPVSYVGEVDYPYTLSVDDFKHGEYILVKLYNLK